MRSKVTLARQGLLAVRGSMRARVRACERFVSSSLGPWGTDTCKWQCLLLTANIGANAVMDR